MSIMRFTVSSNRLLELESNIPRTVGEMRQMFAKDGLDTKDASVHIIAQRNGLPVVGDLEEYVIQDRDIVSFETVEVFAPITAAALEARKSCCQTTKAAHQQCGLNACCGRSAAPRSQGQNHKVTIILA